MRSLLVFALTGCPAAAPCLQSCEQDREFWETCWDELQRAGIGVVCYDESSDLGEALAAAGDDEESRAAVYDEWYNRGLTRECEDADEVVDDCTARTTAEFEFMDAEARTERIDECVDPEPNELGERMQALDCDGVIAVLGG